MSWFHIFVVVKWDGVYKTTVKVKQCVKVKQIKFIQHIYLATYLLIKYKHKSYASSSECFFFTILIKHAQK